MKKCPFCGKEYSDEIDRCLIDNEFLLGGDSLSLSDNKAVVVPMPLPADTLTERQLRIFELVLICAIAFGSYILSSAYVLAVENSTGLGPESSAYGIYKWLSSVFREVSALALLWYVLRRRGRSFLDLGFNWARKDVGRSVILYVLGSLAFYAAYYALYFSGLIRAGYQRPPDYVARLLFRGGISFVTVLFQFLNPFFEELIVRAYVMTEVRALTNSATKAIIVSTVLQMSYHFYQGVPIVAASGAMFLIFSIFYAKTNRIAPVILAHLYSDVGGTLWYLFRH